MTIDQLPYDDFFRLPIYLNRFAASADIQLEPTLKQLFCGDQQFASLRNFAADVIRHATVSERHELVFFQKDNLGVFIASTSSGRR
jgi:hypothetical protein